MGERRAEKVGIVYSVGYGRKGKRERGREGRGGEEIGQREPRLEAEGRSTCLSGVGRGASRFQGYTFADKHSGKILSHPGGLKRPCVTYMWHGCITYINPCARA